MVYGGHGGGTIASLFAAARRSGRLPYPRDAADNRWSLIHLDDLAGLYARLVATQASGVFDAVDGQPLSVRRTLECAAAACGTSASMEDEAMVASIHEQHTLDVMKRDVALSSMRAREVDWSPRYRTFEEGAAPAYAEWCAQ
jgi:nucleoside-diphosphate-sugar epimerase